ncbi:MAG TPA: ABC transporter transmembrane domain-containing protein, partial [Steroidobacteraceae bacterium]|nr:ABC transporter transmembrane domain-containing protein [Steroidobacteraceae bacterium]
MSLLSEVWQVLTPRQRRWLIAAQVLPLLMAFSTLTGTASIAPFFAVLANPHLIEHPGLMHSVFVHLGFTSVRSFVVVLGISFIAVNLAANAINLVGAVALTHLAWWVGTDLQSVLFAEYLRRPFAFHATTHSAVLVNNVVHEAARATNEILQNGLLLVSSAVTAAVIIVAMLLLDPTIAASIMVTLAAAYALAYVVVRRRLVRCGRAQAQAVRDETRVVSESFGAIKEIQVLGIQEFFRAQFVRANQIVAAAVLRTQRVALTPRHVMESVLVAGLVGLALLLN